MTDHKDRNIETYGKNAADLARFYNSKSTPDIWPQFAGLVTALADKGTKHALDIGCGSGRDAFWMASQGLNVTAVDAAAGLLAQADAEHGHEKIAYLEDTAPALDNLKKTAKGQTFDVILLSAFLFHLDKDERKELFSYLSSLLNANGFIFATLRRGPVPEGRVMYDVPTHELWALANQHGLSTTDYGHSPDPMGRAEVSWSTMSIHKPVL